MTMRDDTLPGRAKRLFERFGFDQDISIEQFDIFIIDHGLADDPKTSDTTDIAYRGFVQQRSQAKNKLNRASAQLADNPFIIEVVTAGVKYRLRRWHESSSNIATQLGNKIRDYTTGRFDELQKLQLAVDQRFFEFPDDHELAQTSALFGIMRAEGVQAMARVKAIAYQYNAAADAVEEQALKSLGKYSTDNLLALPAPEAETAN